MKKGIPNRCRTAHLLAGDLLQKGNNMLDHFQYVVVSTTLDSQEKATELSKRLVEAGLAACVHLMPVRSTYSWKGAVETADEIALAAKTQAALSEKILDFIKSHHSYDVPEIIVTPIVDGHRAYLDWIAESTLSALS